MTGNVKLRYLVTAIWHVLFHLLTDQVINNVILYSLILKNDYNYSNHVKM